MTARPWRADERGVILAVRAMPRAKRTEAAGMINDAEGRQLLRLRVAAPPVEGAANKAIVRWLADMLGVRKSDITIVSGETARHKQVEIAGDAAELEKRLAALLASSSP